MQHIALYRKYRPRTFHDLIGQDFIVQTLLNAIKLNKVSHAYIFAGPKGIGKTTIAKIFAKALNCLKPLEGDACEKCEHCKIINENHTTDILELDAASNNGVEDVRNIIEGVQFLPANLNKKVYIIDEAHMLTVAAWNALLKTIEEAPQHVIFIFATTEMYKIPSTIISRAQHFLFKRLNKQQLVKMIEDIAQKENITITNDAIEKIITLVDGSARDCLSILEQLAMFTNNNIKLSDVYKVFGLIDLDNKIDVINLLVSKDTQKIMTLADQYELQGVNFHQLMYDLNNVLIDKLVYLQTNDASILKYTSETHVKKINVSEQQCIDLLNIWQESLMKSKNASDQRFYFDYAIFNSFQIFKDATMKEKPIVPPPTINKEVKTPKQELDMNFFTTKEIKIQEKVVVLNKVNEIDNAFYGIAYNASKSAIEQAKEFLAQTKQSLTSELETIASAYKVLVASKNGVVFLFKDDVEAAFLNNVNHDYGFLLEIRNHFHHPKFIIGFDKEKARELQQNFMQFKKEGRTFSEPNIESLNEVLKSKNDIAQIALEVFKDN